MKYILSLFLGIATLFLIAATSQTTGLLTVKPAMPKVVAAQTFKRRDADNTKSGVAAKEYILNKTREGFILKSINRTSEYSDIIVVMEKY